MLDRLGSDRNTAVKLYDAIQRSEYSDLFLNFSLHLAVIFEV